VSEGPIAGSTPETEDGSRSFLRALARQANTRAAIYVPADGSALTLLVSGDGTDAEETEALEGLGRHWLGRLASGSENSVGQSPQLAFAEVRATDGRVIGALVAVKEGGRTWTDPERAIVRFAVEYYGQTLDPRAAQRAGLAGDHERGSDLEADIRNAVGNGELVLVYQPEIDLLTREVVAVEALLRWQHPERGELGPESFIALAERSGLIKAIGSWVIDESTRALASWNEALPGLDVEMRINVSPVQVSGTDLVGLFQAAIERHHVLGRQLCIELTENAPLRDPNQVADTLRRLKELGIRSAIDDLATGYSTLSQLRSLPVDIIKLDRSLVSGIDHDLRAEAIVTALIGLALNFGLGVIAEGVENEQEVGTLLRLGCTRAQGHHLGKPAVAATVLELLRDRGNGVRKN
jgi:EAL domain-containing protein (putative c-di-GMP-specific phosphodiesterase class I)